MMYRRIVVSLFPKIYYKFVTSRFKSSLQWKQFDEKDVENHVANIFLCNKKEAEKLVDSFRDSFTADRCGKIEILRELRKKGFTVQHVLSCKKTLLMPLESVRDRIKFSTNVILDESLPSIMTVLRLSDKDLILMKRLLSTSHRKIDDFSTLTKCTKLETLYFFVKFPFLMRSKMSTLRSKLDLLIANKLSIEEVKKDLWVLTYTLKTLEGRIDNIKALEICPIKPWMLRCLPTILGRTFSNKFENQAALAPYPHTAAYLAHRLCVKEEEIDVFAKKHPPVMRVQVAKLKDMLDLLLTEGFSPAKIMQTPRILCHSLATIQGRLSDLKNRNYFPQTLSVLCKSQKKYDEFVNKVDQRLRRL